MSQPITLLWIGDYEREEFAPAYRRAAARATIVACATPAAAELLPLEHDFAVIVAAQAYGGQWEAKKFEGVRRRFPLAPVVSLLGTWCEGERRSGLPLPAALRWPWHQAETAFDEELSKIAAGRCPAWGFGETYSEEERCALPDATARPIAGGSVVVAARDPAIVRWLQDFCRQAGVQASPDDERAGSAINPSKPPVVLWDMPAHAATVEQDFAALRTKFPVATLLALANFPRREDLCRWRSRGVVVFSKPTPAEYLQACLRSLLMPAPSKP